MRFVVQKTEILSASAHRHLKKLLSEKPEGFAFRIAVDAGGCNGFQYHFKIDATRTDEDQLYEQDGVQIVIDTVSKPFLDQATVDFVEDLMGSYFKIDNPQASSSCGCGSSFSL